MHSRSQRPLGVELDFWLSRPYSLEYEKSIRRTSARTLHAYAGMYPAETAKLVVMDAFLPGVEGWQAVYNSPGIWHFRFNGHWVLEERPKETTDALLKFL